MSYELDDMDKAAGILPCRQTAWLSFTRRCQYLSAETFNIRFTPANSLQAPLDMRAAFIQDWNQARRIESADLSFAVSRSLPRQ